MQAGDKGSQPFHDGWEKISQIREEQAQVMAQCFGVKRLFNKEYVVVWASDSDAMAVCINDSRAYLIEKRTGPKPVMQVSKEAWDAIADFMSR